MTYTVYTSIICIVHRWRGWKNISLHQYPSSECAYYPVRGENKHKKILHRLLDIKRKEMLYRLLDVKHKKIINRLVNFKQEGTRDL